MLRRARRGVAGFLAGAQGPAHLVDEPNPDTDAPARLTRADLARYRAFWIDLIGDDPLDRLAVEALIEERYPDPDDGELATNSLARAIEQELEWVHLEKSETLVRQGEPSDCLYVVLHGRLSVAIHDASGAERRVGEIGPGQTVGEMGLLTGEPRTATVYAARDTELLRLSKESFDRLSLSSPPMLLGMTRLLTTRLRDAQRAGRRTANDLRTVAVIAAGPGVPLRDFTARLVAALDRQAAPAPGQSPAAGRSAARTLHMSAARLPAAHREDAAAEHRSRADDIALGAWLNDQELRYRFVVYETDELPTAWTQRCIRQADRVLVVGRAGDPPALGAIERELLRPGTRGAGMRQELVLLHDEPQSGVTGSWLAARHVAAHHHLHPTRDEDYDRLVRRLVGRATGLVLGGGGARGFAHIGAFRALQEAGIAVDLVGGTSAGAIVAAQHAMGWDHAEMYERTKALIVDTKALVQYTLPLVSFLVARRFAEALERMLGDAQIEDLWRGYFCVSSNLTRADLMIHERGSLITAVRASSSLPGVLPPVLVDGELLVDGVVLNNLPIDVMAARCDGGDVIAVDVASEFALHREYQFDHTVSGFKLLLSRLNPFARSRVTAPSVLAIMARASELACVRTRLANARQASLYINPPVQDFSTFDVKSYDRLVQLGYDEARRRIESWLAARESRETGE